MHPLARVASTLLLGLTARAAPTSHVVREDNATYNDGIHLAIGPTCGLPSTNGSVTDVNAGLRATGEFKTIVSFGDSFTSDGKFDGSAPDPPVQTGTSPRVSEKPVSRNMSCQIQTWCSTVAALRMDMVSKRTFVS
jgi:hypothetical protein